MKLDLSVFYQLTDVHRCILAAVLFMLPLKKRKLFPLRAILFVLTGLALLVPMQFIEQVHMKCIRWAFDASSRFFVVLRLTPIQFILLIIYLVLISLGLYACCELRPSKALYGAICAYLVQNFISNIVSVVTVGISEVYDGLSPVLPLCIRLILGAALYTLFFFVLIRRLPKNGDYVFHHIMYILPVIFIMLLDETVTVYARAINARSPTSFYGITFIYNALLSLIFLELQPLFRREHDHAEAITAETQLRRSREKQYHDFQTNTEALSRRLHDLKHLVMAVEMDGGDLRRKELLREISSRMEAYDTMMDTGNDALDALLSDTWMRCVEKKIRWTCLADGSCVEHIAPVDLFMMLGNALDNAMEASVKCEDPEQRFIVVNIWRKGRLAFIRVENNCPAEPRFRNGIPQSLKTEPGHGFGAGSIRSVCDQYNGQAQFSYEDGVFRLNVVLPIPFPAAVEKETRLYAPNEKRK